MALDIAGSLLGVDVFQSVSVIASGRGGFWDAMNVVFAVSPIGRVTKIGAKAAKWGRSFSRLGRGLNAFTKAAKYGIKPYKKLRKAIAGKGLIAHHLIPQRFAGLFGQRARDMLAIALTKAEHQPFTNAWRNAITYGRSGTGSASREQVLQEARRIYKDYPDILSALGL